LILSALSSTRIPAFVVAGRLALDRAPIAAGVVIECDGRVLLIKRSSVEENFAGHWGLPGGKAEEGETAEQAARREAREETGYLITEPMVEVGAVDTPNGMRFTTFHTVVKDRFTPTLNAEHTAHRWAKRDNLPEPLHPKVAATLKQIPVSIAEGNETKTRSALIGFLAQDRAPDGVDPRVDLVGRAGQRYDQKSARHKDEDGRLHVAVNNISKAGVNPYLGREIPNHEALGLNPDKIYKLLRDPEELKKAAPTFNSQPLLSRHVPVSADDHQPELVVGSTGSSAVYEHPYLKNGLVVWSKGAIDAIEHDDDHEDQQKELSSAYHYEADMTPGTYDETGEKYDGVMRNIRGNHVALVKTGRAGPDVVVGDEALPNQNGEVTMSKNRKLTMKASVAAGALMGALRPVLAQDAKLNLTPMLLKAKAGRFASAKKGILADLEKALSKPNVLAQDGDVGEIIESVAELLDLVDGNKDIVDDADPIDPNSAIPPDTSMDAGPVEKAQEYLRSKGVDDEIVAGLAAAMNDAPAEDEDPDAKKDDEDGKKKPPFVAKDKKAPAMDSATVTKMIGDAVNATKTSVLKTQREIAEARETVRPVVGQIAMDAECGADVYRAALEVLGVSGAADLHDDALLPVYNATCASKKTSTQTTKVAMDAAATASFTTRFPHASAIKTL